MATEARKRAWTKYNRSKKKRLANAKYREKNREKCLALSKAWSERNKERHLETQKAWRQTDRGRELTLERKKRYEERHPGRLKELRRMWSKTDKGKRSAVNRVAKYREKNPEKVFAQQEARKAMRRGELKRKPCENCGSLEGLQKHHPDYTKPLDIIWLCKPCHTKVHYDKAG